MTVKQMIHDNIRYWESDQWTMETLLEEIAAIWARLYIDHPDDAMELAMQIIPNDIRQAAIDELYSELRRERMEE